MGSDHNHHSNLINAQVLGSAGPGYCLADQGRLYPTGPHGLISKVRCSSVMHGPGSLRSVPGPGHRQRLSGTLHAAKVQPVPKQRCLFP